MKKIIFISILMAIFCVGCTEEEPTMPPNDSYEEYDTFQWNWK